jgi:hypothetical protein
MSDPMTLETRFDRLDKFIAEGRIARGTWGSPGGPKGTACPIRALVPELRRYPITGGVTGYILDTVPSEIMPIWVAGLTVTTNDNVSEENWSEWINRYSQTMRRAAPALSAEDWSYVHQSFLLTIAETVGGGVTPLTELQTRCIAEIKAAIKAREKGYEFGSYTSRVHDLVVPLERTYWREGDDNKAVSANAELFLGIASQFSQSSHPRSLRSYQAARALYRAAGHPDTNELYPPKGWDILAGLFLDTVEAKIEAKAKEAPNAHE